MGTSDQPGTKQAHFGSLDSLRGVAALLVVFYHLPGWYPPFYSLEWVRKGGLMVNFFFVLSGFVLYHGYFGRIRGGRGLAQFMTLRFGRIYPVHLVFLVLFLCAEWLRYLALSRGAWGAAIPAFQDNSLGAFVECLFLVHALGFSSHANAFNFPSWSISTEFYTYLIFGAAAALLSKRSFAIVSLALASVSLTLLLFANTAIGNFHWWLRCICGFFLGCLSCAVYERFAHRKIAGGWSAAALIAFVPFMVLPMSEAMTELVFPLSVFVVLSLALAPESAVSKLLHWRPLRWLGDISYSLYMCHAIVFWVIRQAVRVVLKAPDIVVDSKTVAQVSPHMAAGLYLVAVAGPLVLASLSFRFIENPARRRTRKLVASWRERPSESIAVPDAVT